MRQRRALAALSIAPVMLPFVLPALLVSYARGAAAAQPSVVLNPFEGPGASPAASFVLQKYNSGGSLEVTEVAEPKRAGAGAMRVAWEAEQTEEWGGFVALVHDLPELQMYNCKGASHVSVWFYNEVKQTTPGSCHLRIILKDGSDCPAEPPCNDAANNYEAYYSFHHVLDSEPGWQKLDVELVGGEDSSAPLWRTGWVGAVGNAAFDKNRLRGYTLEVSMNGEGGLGTKSQGAFILDHLACSGDSVLQSSLDFPSLPAAVSAGHWKSVFYNSEQAEQQSTFAFQGDVKRDGATALRLDYMVEQTEEWGGFDAVNHFLPGNAHYDLGTSTHIEIWYNVLQAQSAAGRAHARLILWDNSHCAGWCNDTGGQEVEKWYSFHHILDTQKPGWQSVRVELRGSDSSDSPFWRTGWAGLVGNNELDLSHIKGYTIELSMNGEGALQDTTAGSIVWDGLRAVEQYVAEPSALVLNGFEGVGARADPTFLLQQYNGGGSLAIEEVAGGLEKVGKGAMRVRWAAEATEEWGGFVGLIHDLPELQMYSCKGATHISVWFYNEEKQTLGGSCHLRLILKDGSDCPAEPPCNHEANNYESYYSFHHVLDSEPGWQKLEVELVGGEDSGAPLWRTGWSGATGNTAFDKGQLRGYAFEVSMNGEGGMGSQSQGSFLLDHLACTGPDVLQASLDHAQWSSAVSAGDWLSVFYNSEMAKEQSTFTFQQDVKKAGSTALRLDYVIEQTEEWGGFNSVNHVLPGPAYYDMSTSTHIELWYNVLQAQSSNGRAHARLILWDSSDCAGWCNDTAGGQEVEKWYSFHHILDTASPGWAPIRVELKGSDSSESPFWRTGWAGLVGNNALDLGYIKGYSLELSMNGEGSVQDTTAGSVVWDNVRSVRESGTSRAAAALVLNGFEGVGARADPTFRLERYNNGGSLAVEEVAGGLEKVGKGAMRVRWEAEATEEWGGFVALVHDLPELQMYSCKGATHVSVWFYNEEKQTAPGSCHVRLILKDGSDCPAEPPCDSDANNYEAYYSFHHVLDDEPGWQKLEVELVGGEDSSAPLWRTGWVGAKGNEAFDKGMLRGYTLEVSMSGEGGMGSKSQGSFLLDHLACTGPGVLEASVDFPQWPAAGNWHPVFYNSARAEAESVIAFDPADPRAGDTALAADYVIEQTEEWGGFNSLDHVLPGPAYYDLSAGMAITFAYNCAAKQSAAGRAHARLILWDSSDCAGWCNDTGGQEVEKWYSFHHVLDDEPGWKTATVELSGSDSSESPFWRTGWAGLVGNNVLDTGYIKGFSFELSMNGEGSVQDTTSGRIMFDDVGILGSMSAAPAAAKDEAAPAVCHALEGMIFDVDTADTSLAQHFKMVPFVPTPDACCERCQQEPNCVFWQSAASQQSGGVCYFIYNAAPGLVKLYSGAGMDSLYTNMVIVTGYSTGGTLPRACGDGGVCSCDGGVVDCTGRTLTLVPQAIPAGTTELLLGGNTLGVVHEGMLQAAAGARRRARAAAALALQRLDLRGAGVSFVSDGVFAVAQVVDAPENGLNWAKDVGTDGFGDVCCVPGQSRQGRAMCDMAPWSPCIDCVFHPFVNYDDGHSSTRTLRRSSPFHGIAAQDAGMCGEECASDRRCTHFTWDGRWKNSEAVCHLHSSPEGEPAQFYIKNKRDDYADPDAGTPGYVSGYHWITRAANVSAVKVAASTSVGNGGTVSLRVSLGVAPRRGGVWVTPTVDAQVAAVVFTPPRAYFFASNGAAGQTFSAAFASLPSSVSHVRVQYSVEACDQTFIPPATRTPFTRVAIVHPPPEEFPHAKVWPPVVVVLVFVGSLVALKLTENQRRIAKLFDNNKVAEECAVAISDMRLDKVLSDLSTIPSPNRIQSAFIGIVKTLKQYQEYMPASVLAAHAIDDEEDDEEPGLLPRKSSGIARSQSMRSSKHSQRSVTTRASTLASGVERQRKVGGGIVSHLALGLKEKKTTVQAWGLRSFHDIARKDMQAAHDRYLYALIPQVRRSRGTAEQFSGDRLFIHFNTVISNQIHVTAACTVAHNVQAELRKPQTEPKSPPNNQTTASTNSTKNQTTGSTNNTKYQVTGSTNCTTVSSMGRPTVEFLCGSATGKAAVGNIGIDGMKKYAVVGKCFSHAALLNLLCKECGMGYPLVDSTMRSHGAGDSFFVAPAALYMYNKVSNQQQTAWAVVGKQDAAEDEWMYQLEEAEKKNPYRQLKEAVALYVKGKPDEAEAELEAATGEQVAPWKKWLAALLSAPDTRGAGATYSFQPPALQLL